MRRNQRYQSVWRAFVLFVFDLERGHRSETLYRNQSSFISSRPNMAWHTQEREGCRSGGCQHVNECSFRDFDYPTQI